MEAGLRPGKLAFNLLKSTFGNSAYSIKGTTTTTCVKLFKIF